MKNRANKAQSAIAKSIDRDVDEIVRGSRKVLTQRGQAQLTAMVDPRTASVVGSVCPMVGATTRCSKVKVKFSETVLVSGTTGLGFLTWNPVQMGPISGITRAGMLFTNATTNVLTTSSVIPGTPGTGYAYGQYSGSGALWGPPASSYELQYVCVAAALYVTPVGAATSQNGTIFLHESSTHTGDVGRTFGTVTSDPRTRALRGVQTGGQAEEIVLNWHPQRRARVDGDDFDWVVPAESSPIANSTPHLELIFTGGANAVYRVEGYAHYLVRGSLATGNSRNLVNSRDWDIIEALIAHKSVSGYVGRPRVVEHSMLAGAWEMARKLGGWFRENRKELIGTARDIGAIAGLAL